MAVEKSRRLDTVILPRVRSIRDKTFQQMQGGRVDVLAYLQTQREYADIVRQFRDSLIDLRLAALRINTVAGVRIVY